ncbi:MAG TPA: cation:proton antiporter [Oligoflexus sp.]|uniref:cation:proton antiporter domain-containing protein n=1 Tax=Oligoflexus sp. TaxID=1971216 RepID=UPI002D4997E0|nr:cation:proton antiporter [Oligoflexus sp.]HYX35196.1 cation:proton antiporter [Oligoflexus sp.]
MSQVPHLNELALIAVIGVSVTLILSKLKLPAVAGLLATGALIGPYGVGWVRSMESIEVLAEIGVVFLLFTIGLEFSASRLKHIFKQVALGGFFQVILTIVVTVAIASLFAIPLPLGLFYGFVFSLSSTAIVLRALSERRELDVPHGRFIVGTLIFQDLCVVPMVLIVPFLVSHQSQVSALQDIGLAFAKAVFLVIALGSVSRFVIPRWLSWVDASRSREVFLLAILGICIGTAWLTSLAGLSLALGAFLGGMVVADTQFGQRAMSDILPLRDAFVSVFFISLGMLFQPATLIDQPHIVMGMLFGLVIIKGLVATIAALLMKFPARVAWLAGVGLAQFGEFGFVLSKLATSSGLITDAETRPLLAAGVISMFLTPLLLRMAPHITAGEKLLAPLERLLGVRSIDEFDQGREQPSHHVVIVGFGLAGRETARALQRCAVPHIVLELNAEIVRQAKVRGQPVFYGDATSEEALGHAHLSSARLLVLMMDDPRAAQRVVDTARRVAPDVPILMRTRYLREKNSLLAQGAADVVAEEVEGAVEMIARILRLLDQPRNVIHESIHLVRRDLQESLRPIKVPRPELQVAGGIDGIKIESILVRDNSAVAGRSPVELRLRSSTGLLVIALRRGPDFLPEPDPHQALQPGDIVYVVGSTAAIEAALSMFG